MYLVLSGIGQVRGPDSTAEVAAGDNVMFKPGEAHQIINTGKVDLVYYVIADHSRADIATYPDTPGKLAIKPPLKCFTMNEASSGAAQGPVNATSSMTNALWIL
jgi:uncharacterized cupin superfamily protein